MPENPWCRLTCPAWLLQGNLPRTGVCQVHLGEETIAANYGARHLPRGLPINCFKESLSHGTVPRLHCSLATPRDTNMGKSATTFHSQGSPLRPFQGAPVPTEHFKNHDSALVVVSIWPSLVLLFFLGVWAEACSVWTSNQSAKFAPVPPTPCYKILGWDAPRSPWISITDFNVRCHLTWKVVRLIRGAGAGSEAKSPAFCNGRHMAKKAQIQ